MAAEHIAVGMLGSVEVLFSHLGLVRRGVLLSSIARLTANPAVVRWIVSFV